MSINTTGVYSFDSRVIGNVGSKNKIMNRLEGVIRGREKFERNTHAGGLTNLEKERKKNFLMVRKGTAVKRKTRLGDKQVSIVSVSL